MGKAVSETCMDGLITEMVSVYSTRFYAAKQDFAARRIEAVGYQVGHQLCESRDAASLPLHVLMKGGSAMQAQNEDCYKWKNAQTVLCYECDSCKAGLLEQVRRDWHKLSVLNVIVLIAIYAMGCCAFRNARRSLSDYPYGENYMSKVQPSWDYYWWRWLRDRREQLY